MRDAIGRVGASHRARGLSLIHDFLVAVKGLYWTWSTDGIRKIGFQPISLGLQKREDGVQSIRPDASGLFTQAVNDRGLAPNCDLQQINAFSITKSC